MEKVLKDVRNRFVSIEKLKEDNGVAIDPVMLIVDEEENSKKKS